MISISSRRWLGLLILPLSVLAVFYSLGILQITYEASAVLSPQGDALKGMGIKRVPMQAKTPWEAARLADSAAVSLLNESLEKQKAFLQARITNLETRKTVLTADLTRFLQERRQTSKDTGVPAMSAAAFSQLQGKKSRRALLMERFPNHPDIQILGQEIQSLENQRRAQASRKVSRGIEQGRKIAEVQTEIRLISSKVQNLKTSLEAVQPEWKILTAAVKPRWPVRVSGVLPAAAATVAALLLGVFFLRYRTTAAELSTDMKMDLGLITSTQRFAEAESGSLPDDPLSRKAAGLYDHWARVVQSLYAPAPEPPKNIFEVAEPLLKETTAFLEEGHDPMTRLLARRIIPGDLSSHVTRTVFMAMMSAVEAGMSAVQQQGMVFAALLHDLAVVPRAHNGWEAVGPEVGRLSSGLVRKIPSLPPSLAAMVEAMLVSMDEHSQGMWQNVPRDQAVEPFARLLRQIDRFDKVAQKQKSRIVRRLTHHAA